MHRAHSVKDFIKFYATFLTALTAEPELYVLHKKTSRLSMHGSGTPGDASTHRFGAPGDVHSSHRSASAGDAIARMKARDKAMQDEVPIKQTLDKLKEPSLECILSANVDDLKGGSSSQPAQKLKTHLEQTFRRR